MEKSMKYRVAVLEREVKQLNRTTGNLWIIVNKLTADGTLAEPEQRGDKLRSKIASSKTAIGEQLCVDFVDNLVPTSPERANKTEESVHGLSERDEYMIGMGTRRSRPDLPQYTDTYIIKNAPPPDSQEDDGLLTIAYMNGFENGKASMSKQATRLKAELDVAYGRMASMYRVFVTGAVDSHVYKWFNADGTAKRGGE